jgi:hypothetical protein
MSLAFRIRTLFTNLLAPRYAATSVEDLPDEPEHRIVYLIGDIGTPWSAALVCPCGCKELIQLSLVRNDNPRWRYRWHDDGTVSLDPSVWRTKGCRSHFHIRGGRVVWARDSRAGARLRRRWLGR